MGIDLTGCVRDVYRIGKGGNRRVLKIELLSEHVTKHILENLNYYIILDYGCPNT